MKQFALLMSVYLVFLSCLPCGDGEECNTLPATQQTSATTGHQEHEHTTEACTPFCNCACCMAAAFHQPLVYFRAIPAAFRQSKSPYEFPFYSYDFHAIWQPPKIG